MKVVINKCYGAFTLSKIAKEMLKFPSNDFRDVGSIEFRTNPKLIDCIEKLGEYANGPWSILKIVEIPDDVEFYIDDYDGMETIHEKHRIWS